MAAIKLLSEFLGAQPKFLSKEEKRLLEADLFANICQELKEIFRNQYSHYFNLLKFNAGMENDMLDMNYICFVINDILLTGDYTLSGIAYYTETPEDVVYEIMTGCNRRPSAIFLQRVIELHQEVKRELYVSIRKKIAEKYLEVE